MEGWGSRQPENMCMQLLRILHFGVNVCGPQIPLESVCNVDWSLLLEAGRISEKVET